MIAEDVREVETHEKRLLDPDGYRPKNCLHCGGWRLHAHDFRERHQRGGDPDLPVTIRRYRCTACRACWQILPQFVARWLWRSWPVVESALGVARHALAVNVPPQTLRRWRQRLGSQARALVQALATSAQPALEAVAAGVGLNAIRRALLRTCGDALAALAALIHRLVPGLRLM
ncbi:MAG: DUF6431 domain-containing protein [Terriglobales bacterium]